MSDLSWLDDPERVVQSWVDAMSENKVSDLLGSLGDRSLGERVGRLLMCGFCRQAWDLFDEDYREMIGLAEMYADRQIDFYVMQAAGQRVWDEGASSSSVAGASRTRISYAVFACLDGNVDRTSELPHMIESAAYPIVANSMVKSNSVGIVVSQGLLLASVLGVGWEFDPAWRTDTVVQLSGHIYESRDFSLMPILADALQDAGCDEMVLLTELRDPESQWCRGCRVLDEVLGKR